jgi:hypothetical protein
MTRLLLRVCDRLGLDAVAAPTWLVIVAWCGLVVGTVGYLLTP